MLLLSHTKSCRGILRSSTVVFLRWSTWPHEAVRWESFPPWKLQQKRLKCRQGLDRHGRSCKSWARCPFNVLKVEKLKRPATRSPWCNYCTRLNAWLPNGGVQQEDESSQYLALHSLANLGWLPFTTKKKKSCRSCGVIFFPSLFFVFHLLPLRELFREITRHLVPLSPQ